VLIQTVRGSGYRLSTLTDPASSPAQ